MLSATAPCKFWPFFVPRPVQLATVSVDEFARGVGHNEEPVSKVRRADGESRYIKYPDGVADFFKVQDDVVKHRCA
jgi:hypothetical protein